MSSSWLKVGGRGKKGLIIGGIYREQTLLGQDEGSLSSCPLEERKIWKNVLSQWKMAGRMGQCIVLGDTNLDIMKWNHPDQAVAEMTENTKNLLETDNFTQLINTPTRFWTNEVDSLIDLICINKPQMVLRSSNIKRGTADHNLVQIIYRTKGTHANTSKIVKRIKLNFDLQEYKLEKNDSEPLYHFHEIDPDYSFFSPEKILNIYDKMAPVIKVQHRKINTNRDTRSKMVLGDQKHKTASRTQKLEDWNIYRDLWEKC